MDRVPISVLFDVTGPILFVLREEKNGFLEQDDLLNQDSFITGLKYVKLYLSEQYFRLLKSSVDTDWPNFFSLMSLYSGDFGVSVVSPPHRKPESKFMPFIGTPNHSTPRLISQQVLSAVSKCIFWSWIQDAFSVSCELLKGFVASLFRPWLMTSPQGTWVVSLMQWMNRGIWWATHEVRVRRHHYTATGQVKLNHFIKNAFWWGLPPYWTLFHSILSVAALYQAVSCATVSRKRGRPVRREPCRDRSTVESTKEGTPLMFTPEIINFPCLFFINWVLSLWKTVSICLCCHCACFAWMLHLLYEL